jgi:hypothetical protein
MPLHIQQNNPDSELDPVFGNSIAATVAPTAEFAESEERHDVAYQVVRG